jgi:hypothetical protein
MMSAPHSSPNVSRDSTGLLGLREMSVALESWQAQPDPDGHAMLTSAFRRVVASSGLGGGHLHLHAPPLPEVELWTGSLTPGSPLDPGADTAGLRTYELSFGDRALATLKLDAPPGSRLLRRRMRPRPRDRHRLRVVQGTSR